MCGDMMGGMQIEQLLSIKYRFIWKKKEYFEKAQHFLKTADFTLTPFHMVGKPQMVITKEGGCSQSAVSKHIHKKVEWEERV